MKMPYLRRSVSQELAHSSLEEVHWQYREGILLASLGQCHNYVKNLDVVFYLRLQNTVLSIIRIDW